MENVDFESSNVRTLGCAAGISIMAGLIYLLTAARDIVVGDSPELITAAATLGVAHPPGYPLFTMLGHLFSLLPIGAIPFRVNLISAVCDSLAVGIIFLTGFHLSRSRLAAATAALVLALNPLFWSWSLVAEVFPLNNLLASLLIYLLVIWQETPERAGRLIGASFVAGLAFSNHQTIVLLGPAVCFVLWQRRAVFVARPQIFLICAGVFFLGLLPYLYVPWAASHHPAYNWGNISSLRDVVSLIMRQSYGGYHLVRASYRGGSSLLRIVALFFSIGALMGLLAVVGLVHTWRHRRWYFWFTLLGFICTGPLFAAITNLDLARAPSALFVLERFFILPLVVMAPLIALGVIQIAKFIAANTSRLPIQSMPLVAGAVAVVLAVDLATNFRRIDQSHNHLARNYAEDVFATVGPDTILLVTGDGLAFPLVYLNIVERQRPDVTLIFPLVLPGDWYVRQLRQRHPDLVVPFDRYNLAQNNLKALVEANPRRPVATIGPLQDNSLERDYRVYPYGLVNLIELKSRTITLSQMVSDNEELMKRYRPPSADAINAQSFESEILDLYVQPALLIGNQFQNGGWKPEARAWYRRALVLDPNFAPARRALTRIDIGNGGP